MRRSAGGRGRRLPAVLLALVALGGCETVLSIEGAPAPPDAGTAPDAAAKIDGSTDARRFCESQSPKPTFCSDFDTLPFASEWPVLLESGGGTVRADSTSSTSPPTSFAASSPPIDAGATEGRARLCGSFLRAAGMRIAFDVRVVAVDSTAITSVASIRFTNGVTDPLYVDLESRPTDTWFLAQIQGSTSFRAPFPVGEKPKIGTWTRLVLETKLGPPGAGGTLGQISARSTVTLDDKPVAELQKDWDAPDAGTEFCLGIMYLPRSNVPSTFLFDNVTIDVTPAK